jgi:dihydropteroate synthase
MHMQGEPKTMQRSPAYGDVVAAVAAFLRERTDAALAAGIPRESLIVDPGLGFGKTPEHNSEILRRLGELRRLGFPILVGASRKWFSGSTGGGTAGADGGIAAAVLAAHNGADVLRVHDVASTAKALQGADAVVRRR